MRPQRFALCVLRYAMVVAAEAVVALVVAAVMVVAAMVVLLVVEGPLNLKIARFCRFLKRRNGHTDGRTNGHTDGQTLL